VAVAVSASPNRWIEAKCAKAFWGQHDLPPYKRLLADTVSWASPAPGEDWLDLGCGGGAISRELWQRTEGLIGTVTGVDCAAVNDQKYRDLRKTLQPSPGSRLRFVCHDFSAGPLPFEAGSFDHAVSGLSISYAESFDADTGTWTDKAYDYLLAEVKRVLRPGGRFVFSVNVPEPSWAKVAVLSLGSVFGAAKPLIALKKAGRMLRYGRWLKQEARRGRFHYLPAETVTAKLRAAGFTDIRHRLSYAKQAYVFRAVTAA
jgi:SAM-dependent methyltransferase